MLMTNEYRSAFKRAHSPEEVEDLLASGWSIVEEKPAAPVPQPEAKSEEKPLKTHHVFKGGKKALMYRDKSLSYWVSIANKKELKDIFDYYGIPYSHNITKNDLVIRLRQYIREAKAEQRREKNDGE